MTKQTSRACRRKLTIWKRWQSTTKQSVRQGHSHSPPPLSGLPPPQSKAKERKQNTQVDAVRRNGSRRRGSQYRVANEEKGEAEAEESVSEMNKNFVQFSTFPLFFFWINIIILIIYNNDKNSIYANCCKFPTINYKKKQNRNQKQI